MLLWGFHPLNPSILTCFLLGFHPNAAMFIRFRLGFCRIRPRITDSTSTDMLCNGRSIVMESGGGFLSADELRIDPKWLIDHKQLFVGPRIGEGAHAKVYEGKYKNQNVAIKVVHRGETPEELEKREERFLREVVMLSRVQHKNLVKFIGACKESVMVVMTELRLGGSLRKYMLILRTQSLDPRVAVGFALDFLRVMECLHSHGIIHRDLKPG